MASGGFEHDPGLKALKKDASTSPKPDAPARDASAETSVTGAGRQAVDEDAVRGPDDRPVDEEDDEDTPVSEGDAGEVVPDASESPASNQIAGSLVRANCGSATPRKGDHCGGFYCGVTEGDLARELNTDCTTPQILCEPEVTKAGFACTEDVVVSDPFASDEKIQEAIFDCLVKKRPEVADTPVVCQACSLPMLRCTIANCVAQCSAGAMSPACDKCRIDSGCSAALYACTGQPSPL